MSESDLVTNVSLHDSLFCIGLIFLNLSPVSSTDIQRRIELIQDFEMPTVCTALKVSRDGQYILAAGLFISRFAHELHTNTFWTLSVVEYYFKHLIILINILVLYVLLIWLLRDLLCYMQCTYHWRKSGKSHFHIFVLQAHTNPGSGAMTRISCL